MAVKAKATVTISHLIDISSVTRYYLLQSSTAAAPAKPTTNPPSSSWSKTEPSYTSGSTNTLYFVDCTEFTNDTFKYSEVSKSSSYEAAKEAYNKAQNAQETANSAKDFTDRAKNNYGYQYKYDITINGDANTYYPVVLRGGTQEVMREIMVFRGFNETAPTDWNGHPTQKGISLLLKIKCNFGGWGGCTYSWWIHDLNEMYGNVFASAGHCMANMGFYIFLRGGGTTGAIYHIYSDQPLVINFMNGSSPSVYYDSDRIGWSGGTEDNPTYSWNAPAPRTLTDDIKNEIASKKYIEVTSKTETRVTAAETAIEQNKEAIALRATKTEVTTEVTTAIGNIKIGGRNLLASTSSPVIHTGTGSTNQVTNLYNTSEYYRSITDFNGKTFTLSFDWETTATSGTFLVQLNGTPWWDMCKKVTVSSSNNSGRSVFTFGSDSNLSTGNYNGIQIRSDNLTGTITIKNAMFEEGNKPSSWQPAPEDVDDNINDTAETLNTKLTKTITDHVAAIQTNADSISASVEKLETSITEDLDDLRDDIQTVRNKVDLQLTEDEVNIQIDKKLQNGVTKVETSTGFKFDENGLNINKSGSPTNTQITENGMTVNNTETGDSMLTADKDGVDAKNLRASTYLIVGGRSRFENYGTNRTGCFWIGE